MNTVNEKSMWGRHDQKNEAKTDIKEKEKMEAQKRKERSPSGVTPEDKLARTLDYEDSTDSEDVEIPCAQVNKECIDSPSLLQKVEDALNKLREKEDFFIKSMSELGKIGTLHEKISELITSVSYVSNTVNDLKNDIRKVKQDMQQQEYVKVELDAIKRQNKMLKEKINDMENYSRRDNMEITGIEEHKSESVRDICTDLFKNKLGLSDDIEIVRCHRVGKYENRDQRDNRDVNSSRGQFRTVPRPILLRFKYYADKEKVLKKRAQLKGTGIYLNEDLSYESKRKRTNLVPVLKSLRDIDPKTHFRGDRIFYKGRLYGEHNLYDLPVDAHNTSTKSRDGVTIFSGKLSKLSNLHQCDLKLDGRTWHSVEQYVQFNKAVTVGDQEKAARIMSTDDSQEAMYIGKSINTEHSSWGEKAAEVMKAALLVKFSDPAFKLALQMTESIIGESIQHKVWGTGLSMGHQQAFNPRQWKGENVTGKLLSKVKSELGS